MNNHQIDTSKRTFSAENVQSKEYLTVILYASIWICWLLITYFHAALPLWLLYLLGSVTICVFGSYQHEAVHNHPTKNKSLNYWLAWPPLHLWIPFESYLQSHLQHHRCELLADPYDDPESYYWHSADWQKKPLWTQSLYRINNTMLGRFIIGPWLVIGRYVISEGKDVLSGNVNAIRYWIIHIAGCAVIMYWVVAVAEMSFWTYLLCFVYGGTSLTLMRSFMEHRPATTWSPRTLIVEGSWFSQLLFLNNNFHVLHHEKPDVPWYEIKRIYFLQKQRILRENEHYFFASYWQMLKKFALRAKDDPRYPYPHINTDKQL